MSPKTRLKEKEKKLARRSYQEAALGLDSFDDNNNREVVNIGENHTRQNATLTPSNRTRAQLEAFPNRGEQGDEPGFSGDFNSLRPVLDRLTTTDENVNNLPDNEQLVNSLGNRLEDMEKRMDNKFSTDLRNTRIVIEEQVENAMIRLERLISQVRPPPLAQGSNPNPLRELCVNVDNEVTLNKHAPGDPRRSADQNNYDIPIDANGTLNPNSTSSMLDLTDLGHRNEGRIDRQTRTVPQGNRNLVANNGMRLFATDDQLLQVDPNHCLTQTAGTRPLSHVASNNSHDHPNSRQQVYHTVPRPVTNNYNHQSEH